MALSGTDATIIAAGMVASGTVLGGWFTHRAAMKTQGKVDEVKTATTQAKQATESAATAATVASEAAVNAARVTEKRLRPINGELLMQVVEEQSRTIKRIDRRTKGLPKKVDDLSAAFLKHVAGSPRKGNEERRKK